MLFCFPSAVVPVLTLPCKGLTGTRRCTRWSRRTRSHARHLVSPTPLKCCKKCWRLMRKVRSMRICNSVGDWHQSGELFCFFLNLNVAKGKKNKVGKACCQKVFISRFVYIYVCLQRQPCGFRGSFPPTHRNRAHLLQEPANTTPVRSVAQALCKSSCSFITTEVVYGFHQRFCSHTNLNVVLNF